MSITYRRSKDVRFRIVGDEGVAVRQQAAEVLALNGVGARVMSLLDTERALDEITASLQEEYDVDAGDLARDVAAFVSELVAAGLAEEVR